MIKMQLPSHTYQARPRLKYEKTALRKIKWPRMHKVEMRIKVLIDANQHITIESLQNQFAGQTEKKAVIGFVTEKERYCNVDFALALLENTSGKETQSNFLIIHLYLKV